MNTKARAAALYAEGRAAEKARDYRTAKRCYAESLELHDDPKVRAAYDALTAATGPM